MKHKKKALFQSVISLLLCFSMLLGTTFAWFTDGISSGTNLIAAGSLDIELDYLAADGTWKPMDESTEVLDKDALWEPGYTEVAYLRITNAGTLALKYALGIGILAETGSVNAAGEAFKLSDYIEFGVVESETAISYADRAAALDALTETKYIHEGYSSTYSMKNKGDVRYVAMVVYMPESVGNAANYATGKNPPKIELGIELVATQEVHESDSFGSNYDANAELPGFSFPENVFGESASAGVTTDDTNKTTEGITIQGGSTNAVIPAGVQLEEDTESLTLEVTSMNESNANITLGENDEMRSLNVHVTGVSADNTVPMEITIKEAAAVGLNAGNLTLYHVENGVSVAMTAVDTFTAHNQFKYDPATGDITLYMATFSEVALVADTENAWNGTVATAFAGGNGTETSPYVIANADQLAYLNIVISNDNDNYGSKHYKLIADINLNESTWYPIGYWKAGSEAASIAWDEEPEAIYEINEESKNPTSTASTDSGTWYTYGGAFSGTFDGTGHTVCNIYQNTWQLKGDYCGSSHYWNDAMGLFGYVYDGTIKNLTVSNFSSDGEFTPTGVIAAYAAGTSNFQNIAITNCNPRVYNTGNGGIIGIAGNSSGGDKITLSNITVDNSNKISALWGSWDVACGGLVGMFRGNNNGSTISFTNCHVAAQIDVYNDVCANYQYYAYRYAGMIIGSVRNNTTNDEGKSIPNMTGITATGCTVNYGDWNDYYYCEFEENTMASYSEDFQFSRVPNSEIDTSNGKENATCIGHDHTAAEDKRAVYLPFHQLFTGYGWGVNSVGLKEYSGIYIEGVSEGEQEESVEKFETKFTGDFLYRVGNQNTVTIGDLFAAKDGATINDSGVYVRIDKLYDDADVTCTFTPSTSKNADDTINWEEGTLKFEGTGVVDIVIQDYDFCTPTTLHLEVVDAVNAATATGATANNVVLLSDCGFSSLDVKNGYTLYGNGFTMTCSTDSYAKDFGYAFVTLEDGTLDNVQIVCPNFDYAALYKSNLTSSDNRSYTDASGTIRYYNARSGVLVSGNSQILNSRISGARAAVNISGGNCVIDNSRIERGAVASVLVGAANSVTLRDVTLVQKPTASTYDSNKTLMGFSVLVMATSGGDAAPITLEGTLTQNAWVDENDKQYVPEDAQTIIDTVMGKEEYLHDIDGDGTNESLNLGIAYMPSDGEYTVNIPSITDNRTNKDTIPYDSVEVKYSLMTTYVYSYKNTNGTDASTKEEGEYTPGTQSDIISVTYSDTADGLTTGKSYGTDGWVYELNVDLDKVSSYALDFSKLSMSVNGVTVTDFKVNSSDKPTSPVTVTAGGTTYTLTATVNETEYTATLKVTGTETSKESPSLVASDYEAGLCVASSYGGTWHGAAPVLEGIQIKYWSVAEQQYKTITLSDYAPTTAGQQNGTNSYWTYTPDNGDFTLTIKNETAVHSGNSVYAMPVVCDSKLYFVASSSNGLVNSGNSARTIAITYYFHDNNNGDQLKFSNTWSVEENKDDQYKYSDFCSGTKTKLENCVTPDTLITLADGSQVRVDSLTGNEELLVWNLETGKYDTAPIVFVDSENESKYEIIHLYFSDGSNVKVIYEHGFFDLDLGEYVYIDAANYADYIGHRFVAAGNTASNGWNIVTLDNVVLETEVTTAWSPVTAEHLCYYTNGVLSMPGGIEGLFNIFEVDTDLMRYDAEQMQKDIETYGLFTLEDFDGMITEEAFQAFNGAYLKVAIGKGLLTWEDIAYMAERYIPLM